MLTNVTTYNGLFFMLHVPRKNVHKVPTTLSSKIFWDSPPTSQTRQTKLTVHCVLETSTTTETQYLILSTSAALR